MIGFILVVLALVEFEVLLEHTGSLLKRSQLIKGLIARLIFFGSFMCLTAISLILSNKILQDAIVKYNSRGELPDNAQIFPIIVSAS